MDLNLKDKVVFISGAGQGIGRAIAKTFLEEEAFVYIVDKDESKLTETIERFKKEFGSNIQGMVGDMLNEKDIITAKNALLDTWKKVDIIIPNVGGGKAEDVNQTQWNEWLRFFELNIGSAVKLVNVFTPTLKEQKQGSIVFVSSIAGAERTRAPLGYAAAKASILSFMKNISLDFAASNIRVNAVLPGNVYFVGGRWEEIVNQNPNIGSEYIEKEVPQKRFGKPEEIASTVVFLASPRSSFTTGSSLIVDGGETHSL